MKRLLADKLIMLALWLILLAKELDAEYMAAAVISLSESVLKKRGEL